MADVTTTGTEVLTAIPGEQPPDDKIIGWLNAAISASWPHIKIREYAASAVTLVASTYTYSLSGVTPALSRKLGVGKVLLNADSYNPIEQHGIKQYFDETSGFAGSWTLVVPSNIADGYAGKTLDIIYQHAHSLIDALDDTIALPLDYLLYYIKWLQISEKMETQTTEQRSLPQLMNQYYQLWNDVLMAHHSAQLMLPVLPGYERAQTA